MPTMSTPRQTSSTGFHRSDRSALVSFDAPRKQQASRTNEIVRAKSNADDARVSRFNFLSAQTDFNADTFIGPTMPAHPSTAAGILTRGHLNREKLLLFHRHRRHRHGRRLPLLFPLPVPLPQPAPLSRRCLPSPAQLLFQPRLLLFQDVRVRRGFVRGSLDERRSNTLRAE